MKLQVFRSPADHQWRARFWNKGRNLMVSEGYKRKAGAINVAASIRGRAIEATIDVLDEDGNKVGEV
jgi:uncharacterized protein YegP (UPF0339 family)